MMWTSTRITQTAAAAAAGRASLPIRRPLDGRAHLATSGSARRRVRSRRLSLCKQQMTFATNIGAARANNALAAKAATRQAHSSRRAPPIDRYERLSERDRQTDRRTNGRTDGQTDVRTDRQSPAAQLLLCRSLCLGASLVLGNGARTIDGSAIVARVRKCMTRRVVQWARGPGRGDRGGRRRRRR